VWIYAPSRYVQEAADSSWESVLPVESAASLLASSVTWKGRPTRKQSWLSAWKKEVWIGRLYGQISRPLTLARGVEKWISSLAGIPASRSATLAAAPAKKTLGTSGPTFARLSSQLDLPFASSRTSTDTSPSDTEKSDKTWKIWVTRLRKESLARRKWATASFASGSLSWPAAAARDYRSPNLQSYEERGGGKKGEQLNNYANRWPTPTSGDAKGPGSRTNPNNNARDGTSLTDAAQRMWSTLTRNARPSNEIAVQWGTPRVTTNGGIGSPTRDPKGRLEDQVTQWPTPRASYGSRGGPNQRDSAGCPALPSKAAQWYTPNTPTGGRSVPAETVASAGSTASGKRTVGLESQTRHWPTPSASLMNDAESPESFEARQAKWSGTYHNSTPLTVARKTWSTPRSSPNENRGSGHAPSHGVTHGRTLAGDATTFAVWPTPRAVTGGAESGARKKELGRTKSGGGDLQADTHAFSLPNQTTTTPGSTSLPREEILPLLSLIWESAERRKLLRLNPNFVEWLMGWPPNWSKLTPIEPSDYSYWETASCHLLQDLLSVYWQRS
jgi:hypothetical protein